MRMALLLLVPLLAGCATQGDAAWHIAGIQCEAYPWGDAYGAEVEAPGLEERLEASYGFAFERVAVVHDDKGYAAVCGSPGGQFVEARVTGQAATLEGDGWQRGNAPT